MYPILFDIGHRHVYAFGVLLLVGFYVVFRGYVWLLPRRGLEVRHLLPLLGIGLFSGLFGLQIEMMLLTALHLAPSPHGWLTWHGMSDYGGFLLLVPLGWLYVRAHGQKLLPYMDVGTCIGPLGLGIGRIGCFLGGCCYGAPTKLPWAVTYSDPRSQAAAIIGVPVHPTQLYMTVAMWTLFAFLCWLMSVSKRDGQVSAAFLIGYSLIRFFLEMVRADPDRGSWFGGLLTSYQLACIVVLMIGVALAAHTTRRAPDGRPGGRWVGAD